MLPYRKMFKYYIKKVADENGFKWELERIKYERYKKSKESVILPQ